MNLLVVEVQFVAIPFGLAVNEDVEAESFLDTDH